MRSNLRSCLIAFAAALGFAWTLGDSLATVIEPLTAYLLAGCLLMALLILALAFAAAPGRDS